MAVSYEPYVRPIEVPIDIPEDYEAFDRFGSVETLGIDTITEAGNVGEMILALPQIVGRAGSVIVGGTLDYFEEQGRANFKDGELKKRIEAGEEIPRAEYEKIVAEIEGATWKNSFRKLDKISTESAEPLNLGGHLGNAIEFYSKQLGLEDEYKEFKETYDDRSKLSLTTRFMNKVGHAIESGAEDMEGSIGIPKEASVAMAELLLLKTNSIAKGGKAILDNTGVTTVSKRAGDVVGLKTSDLAKDEAFINTILKDEVTKGKPFKEGPVEAKVRADAFERKMEGTQYGPVLKQNKGELSTNYESGMAYFNNLRENIDNLEKTLKESKTQEDFELSMANIAKQQGQTDKMVMKEVYQGIQGKYIKERGKKAYDDFIRKVELKQEGQKIKLDSLENEIWKNVYEPLRKFNELGTLELAKNGRLEYNDIIVDPKVAGQFQPRIYMHKANTWLQNILENITGSKVRGKQMEGEVAMFGEQRNLIAATRGQEYYAVERPIPVKLFEMLNNWKKGSEIIRDSKVPARGPSPKNPDGTINWKIKGEILRDVEGKVIMTNRGIFQEFSKFLWLADQLNVYKKQSKVS